MSFILNLFSSNNNDTLSFSSLSSSSTTSEKQNAAALKALIKSHKQSLRAEYSRLVLDYKVALEIAAQEHKRARKQAEEILQRRSVEAVRREMELIAGSEEVLRADEKTKATFLEFQRSWMHLGAAGAVDSAGDADVIGNGLIGGRGGEMRWFGDLTTEEDVDTLQSRSSCLDGKVTFLV
ncbi:hypothetical protein BGX29_009452 [Mortierella sp. GBA35]|nr:hypothetical protein BGX29_009452 [Mortierella sp. GBA35]